MAAEEIAAGMDLGLTSSAKKVRSDLPAFRNPIHVIRRGAARDAALRKDAICRCRCI